MAVLARPQCVTSYVVRYIDKLVKHLNCAALLFDVFVEEHLLFFIKRYSVWIQPPPPPHTPRHTKRRLAIYRFEFCCKSILYTFFNQETGILSYKYLDKNSVITLSSDNRVETRKNKSMTSNIFSDIRCQFLKWPTKHCDIYLDMIACQIGTRIGTLF